MKASSWQLLYKLTQFFISFSWTLSFFYLCHIYVYYIVLLHTFSEQSKDLRKESTSISYLKMSFTKPMKSCLINPSQVILNVRQTGSSKCPCSTHSSQEYFFIHAKMVFYLFIYEYHLKFDLLLFLNGLLSSYLSLFSLSLRESWHYNHSVPHHPPQTF